MKKIMMLFAAVMLTAFAYTFAFGDAMEEPIVRKTLDSANFAIGKEVWNLDDEILGAVKDLVLDSEGHISFAILSYGGFLGIAKKEVAVPYTALTYDEENDLFYCYVSKDQLADAPPFGDRDRLTDRSLAEEIYRHFGQQPYWTEEGSMQEGMTEEGLEGKVIPWWAEAAGEEAPVE